MAIKRSLTEYLLYSFYAVVLVSSLAVYEKTIFSNSLSTESTRVNSIACPASESNVSENVAMTPATANIIQSKFNQNLIFKDFYSLWDSIYQNQCLLPSQRQQGKYGLLNK